MLKPLWSARWYLLLGLLVFLLSLALTTPIHFIWRFIEPGLQDLPLQIEQPRGTVWQGKTSLRLTQLPSLGRLEAQWQLRFLPLFLGQAQLLLKLEGEDVRLELPLKATLSQFELNQGQGYLDLRALNPLLKQQHGSAQGHVELNGLTLQADINSQQIDQLAGQLTYSGGDISLLIDGKPVNASMPALIGPLAMAGANAQIDIQTLEGESLVLGYLQPDSWAGLNLKRRFMDVIGQVWPAQVSADTVIFEVSHKLR